MRTTIRAILCLLPAALAGCAGAAIEGANIARDRAVHDKHIALARLGDAEAQYRVGDALCCSLGDRQGFYDTRNAVEYLCRAAAQGHAPASQKLAQIYSGHVVDGVRVLRRVAERVAGRPQDRAVSYAWLRVAAAQGAAEAEADAVALWADLDGAEQGRARTLVTGGQPLPCRWDEVFRR